jgi:hypothetical protein
VSARLRPRTQLSAQQTQATPELSHITRLVGHRGMGLLALTADFWALFWTTLVTVVFLLVPGVVYAYYVLERWIDDDDSYARVMASVDRRDSNW